LTDKDVAKLREQSRDEIRAALPELRSRYGTGLT
ncbi:MAG: hypothetical protein JWM74_1037, partial [Myxococcaceae bacterium]|nr:hypothetical protein [Myxococcaceae bacterium]